MPTFNDEPQQPTPTTTPDAPPSTPSPAIDWERKYNGLQGQFKNVSSERDTFAAQVTKLTTEYEGQIAQLSKAKEDFEKQFQERSQVAEKTTGELAKTQAELAALKTVLKDFTDLAPLVAKGTLRVDGLSGDDLTKYLTQAREDLKGVIQEKTSQNLQGSSPQPPTGGTTPSMTLFEAQDKMNDALRRYGSRSEQYISAVRMVDEIMRVPPK